MVKKFFKKFHFLLVEKKLNTSKVVGSFFFTNNALFRNVTENLRAERR